MPDLKWKLGAVGVVFAGLATYAIMELGDRNWLCLSPDCYTIKASKVSWSTRFATNRAIAATFTVSYSNFNAMESNRTGGACLVADLREVGYPSLTGACSLNGHCQAGLPSGWFGYCDRSDGPGVCWVRPGGQNDKSLCNKTIPAFHNPVEPWVDGEANPVGLYPYVLSRLSPYAGGKTIRFRAVACLQGPSRGCAEIDSDDRIEVFGEPESFPIPPFVISRPKGLPIGGDTPRDPPKPTDKRVGPVANVGP
jgi:hypothetical protein